MNWSIWNGVSLFNVEFKTMKETPFNVSVPRVVAASVFREGDLLNVIINLQTSNRMQVINWRGSIPNEPRHAVSLAEHQEKKTALHRSQCNLNWTNSSSRNEFQS